MGIEPGDYYDDIGEEEWERSEDLFVHSVEHENTYPYLEQHLPDDGHILDAGGAAGRYAVWLAERGYEVTLIDISGEQLRIAREKLKERGLLERVSIQEGDIRDLDFQDRTFDAVLCLGGPLSHVVDENERRTAAAELVRVAKDDHPVFVSVMGFYAALVIHALEKWGFVWKIEDFYERQKYDQKHINLGEADEEAVFADTYFFRSSQLRELLESNGLRMGKMVGLENIVSVIESIEDAEEELSEDYKDRLRTAAEMIREDDAAPDLSNHILAIGWKKE